MRALAGEVLELALRLGAPDPLQFRIEGLNLDERVSAALDNEVGSRTLAKIAMGCAKNSAA